MRINQRDTQQGDEDRVLHQGQPFTGEVERTDADGEVLAVNTYVRGVKDGLQRYWYPGGVLQQEETADLGITVGELRRWYPNGQLSYLAVHSGEGVILHQTSWDHEGNLIEERGPDVTAEEDFDRGVRERAAGNAEKARRAFYRASVSGGPDISAKALANLAVLEASTGRIAPAIVMFQEAIATGHPDHAPQSMFNFAIFLQRLGDLARARHYYELAVAGGHPEHSRKALFNLANLSLDQGRVTEACGHFLRAMEPPFLGDTASRAHRRLLEIDSGRLAEAREVYLRAVTDATAAGDTGTATRARDLLFDLDPSYQQPDRVIEIGRRRFTTAEIEDAEWANGRPPRYGSGYLDLYTRDGEHHVLHVDPGDPYDSRGLAALRQLLGPGGL
ncbi:hypothetical protein CFP65_7443 [Kitasatospora sp. MMS16-BH015]|uniref:tetratricopeptide repeat protein n=1 Tax=Kitasatospora sp. MMS16-BH015 TaxID=2018025 RepID=UPI000CA3679A|nr:tetratricopeptide repeat protein [Kitasatospora sp. MMS16-BH015]AUG82023.1 hypothetical protein CFP65_7443 [Kitasatospora sp. MMS16-BH015]